MLSDFAYLRGPSQFGLVKNEFKLAYQWIHRCWIYPVDSSWTTCAKCVFFLYTILHVFTHSSALSGLLRHATNACCSRRREPSAKPRFCAQEHHASCLWVKFWLGPWDPKEKHPQALASRCSDIWVCSHRKTDWKICYLYPFLSTT